MTGYREFDPQPDFEASFEADREVFQNWIDTEMQALSRHVEAHRRFLLGPEQEVPVPASHHHQQKENIMTARPNFEAIRNEVRNAADAGDLGPNAREISQRAEARIAEAEAYVKWMERQREHYREVNSTLAEQRTAAVKRVDELRRELDEANKTLAELKQVEPEDAPSDPGVQQWMPSDFDLRRMAIDAAHSIPGPERIDVIKEAYAFLKGEEWDPARLTVKHDTLDKVYAALPQFDWKTVHEAITAVLNAGIVFRERA